MVDAVKAMASRRVRRRGAKSAIEPMESLHGQRIVGNGGSFNPLSPEGIAAVHGVACELLAETGLSEAPASAIQLVEAAGGRVSDTDRLLFPRSLVELAINGLSRDFTLHGRVENTDLVLKQNRVYVGTGGASPQIFDMQSGRYRESCLGDLYDAARLVDTLTHIHFFSRPLVARDMADIRRLDVNTAYASLMGTQKHVFTSANNGQSVRDIATICYQLAGSKAAFLKRPFLTLNVNHAVPPMRFDSDAVEVLIEAVRCGIPVSVNTFGQLGASSPVTIAGCVAQTTAETLAGMVLAWLVDEQAKAVFGPRPMITDLRTGAMAGGCGEQAMLTAAAAQMARHYGLPSSTIAGATESKIPDAQSGYEKCLTVAQTVQAGANIVTQSCGAQASLMGISFEALVVDNDMLGCILRATNPVDISPQTLSARNIGAVASGAGHFLGEADTYARMHSDFLYPGIADRSVIDVWEAAGSNDIRHVAAAHAREVLKNHRPRYIDRGSDAILRASLPIELAV